MATRRPLVLVTGSPNTWRELPNSDELEVGSAAISLVTGLKDTNGNLCLGFVAAASAVNYLQVQNNATGQGPRLIANGPDTNIDLVLLTKGSGVVKARYSGVSYELATLTTAQTLTNKTLAAGGGCSIDASLITGGTVATARLGAGTANASTFLRGDQTYATPPMGPTLGTVLAASLGFG